MKYGEHYNYQRALWAKVQEDIRNEKNVLAALKKSVCSNCGKETSDLQEGICNDCWEQE